MLGSITGSISFILMLLSALAFFVLLIIGLNSENKLIRIASFVVLVLLALPYLILILPLILLFPLLLFIALFLLLSQGGS